MGGLAAVAPRARLCWLLVKRERKPIMAERPFPQADLDELAQWDPPTICNGLEIVVPERRAIGFTVEPMVCIDPKAKPIVGLARVGMIRSTEPPRSKGTDRADWYDYVARVDFRTIE